MAQNRRQSEAGIDPAEDHSGTCGGINALYSEREGLKHTRPDDKGKVKLFYTREKSVCGTTGTGVTVTAWVPNGDGQLVYVASFFC